VDNHATKPRLERTATILEDGEPTTDLTERVIHRVPDVQPEELSGVVVRIVIERSAGDVRADLLNGFLIHIRVEDISGLIRGGVVSRVDDPLLTVRCRTREVGVNLRERAVSVGVAGNLKVNEVIEPTEATINTEGSNKLARRGIAEILTQIAVGAEQLAARFSGGNQSEDCGSVLTTERVVTSTITDKLNANNIKLILRKLGRRLRKRGVASVAVVQVGVASNGGRNRGSVIFSLRSRRNLRDEAEILRTTAVVQNRAGKLGQLLDSLGDLTLNLKGGLQIVQADARSLIGPLSEVPSNRGLTELEILGSRNATIGRRSSDGGGKGRSSGNIVPDGFKVTGENTLNRSFRQSRSHSEGELSDASKAAPRGLNLITLLNINGETICFPLEQVVHCGTSNSHNKKY